MDLLEIFYLENNERTYYKVADGHIIVLDMPFKDVRQSLTDRYEGYYIKFIPDSSLRQHYQQVSKSAA
ncbi:MAG: hypothetical protein HN576_14345 [Bacteriovoracaceae bacterium]|jgi:hypothetical protein|nr:hypothetical protein [Bacteriovoracaceae bacterium]